MTRADFDKLFAATANNWFQPETLNELNDRAYAFLSETALDDPDIDNLVKWAFDRANNQL